MGSTRCDKAIIDLHRVDNLDSWDRTLIAHDLSDEDSRAVFDILQLTHDLVGTRRATLLDYPDNAPISTTKSNPAFERAMLALTPQHSRTHQDALTLRTLFDWERHTRTLSDGDLRSLLDLIQVSHTATNAASLRALLRTRQQSTTKEEVPRFRHLLDVEQRNHALAHGAEILVNGNFDEPWIDPNAAPAGWTLTGSNHVDPKQETVIVRGGPGNSCRLGRVDTSGAPGLRQVLVTAPNMNYLFEGWYQLSGRTSGSIIVRVLEKEIGQGASSAVVLVLVTADASEWTRFSGGFTAKPGFEYTVEIVQNSNVGSTFYVDDMGVFEVLSVGRSLTHQHIESHDLGDGDLRALLHMVPALIKTITNPSYARTLADQEQATHPIQDALNRSLVDLEQHIHSVEGTNLRTLIDTEIEAHNIEDEDLRTLLDVLQATMSLSDGHARTLLDQEQQTTTLGDLLLRSLVDLRQQNTALSDAHARALLTLDEEARSLSTALLRTLFDWERQTHSAADGLRRTLLDPETYGHTLSDEDLRTLTHTVQVARILSNPTFQRILLDAEQEEQTLTASLLRTLLDIEQEEGTLSDAHTRTLLDLHTQVQNISDEDLRSLIDILQQEQSTQAALARTLLDWERQTHSISDGFSRTLLGAASEERILTDSHLRSLLDLHLQARSLSDEDLRTLLDLLQVSQALTEAGTRTLLDQRQQTRTEVDALERTLLGRRPDQAHATADSFLRTLADVEVLTQDITDEDLRTLIDTKQTTRPMADALIRALLRTRQQAHDSEDAQARTLLSADSVERILADSNARSLLDAELVAQNITDEDLRDFLSVIQQSTSKADSLRRSLAPAPQEEHVLEDDFCLRIFRFSQVDLEAIRCALNDVIHFTPMWSGRVYGPNIWDLLDMENQSAFDPETIPGLARKRTNDVLFYQAMWMGVTFGPFLLDFADVVDKELHAVQVESEGNCE